MNSAELTQEISKFVSEATGGSEVNIVDPNAPLADLGVDSFALLEIVLFVERRHGVKLPIELLTSENTRTVADIARTAAAHHESRLTTNG